MKRTRQILVLTLVATALCADRMAAATPQIRVTFASAADPIARLATNLAERLSGSFRRDSSSVRLLPSRRVDSEAASAGPCTVRIEPMTVWLVQGTPYRFRLPPPAV